jgi:hypothetical protein
MGPGSRPGHGRGGSDQARRQVFPAEVALLDQRDLPVSAPALQTPLAFAGRLQRVVNFVIDEPLDAIGAGETGNGAGAMLLDPAGEIDGDADIERAARLACEDIDVERRNLPALCPGLEPGPIGLDGLKVICGPDACLLRSRR